MLKQTNKQTNIAQISVGIADVDRRDVLLRGSGVGHRLCLGRLVWRAAAPDAQRHAGDAEFNAALGLLD